MSLLSAKVAEAVGAGDLSAALLGSGRVPEIVLRALGANPLLGRSYASTSARKALYESARSDALAVGAKPDYSGLTASAVELARSLGEVERRCNLSMAEDARASYLAIVSDLVPRAARSEISREAAVAEGVRRMAERGVRVVEYSSGRRDRPEVVMRRHVQTLLKQASTDYTADLCRRVGVRLVEVDSHVGARPSHRLWQGRVYGLDGPVEVGGVRYPGLAESGAADGLHEPNCRHSMAPYVPGRARRWSETPDEDAGHDPEAYYGATQRQRANERAIRDAKREAAALRAEGLDDAAARLRLGRAQAAQRRLLAEYPALKRRPERERAFDSKGRQIGARPLNRRTVTIKDFMESDDATRAMAKAGVSKTAARKELAEAMRSGGVSAAGFSAMDASGRMSIFKRAIAAASSTGPEGREMSRALGCRVSLHGVARENREMLRKGAVLMADAISEVSGAVSSVETCPVDKVPIGFESAYAWYDRSDGKLTVSLRLFSDPAVLRQAFSEDSRAGYHPAGCDASQVMAHELAHAVDAELIKRGAPSAPGLSGIETVGARVQAEIMHESGFSMLDVERAVSKYAADYGPEEWFAEALSEAVVGDNPREVAKNLLKWVKDEFKKVAR